MKKISLVVVFLGAGIVAANAQDTLPSFNLFDQYSVFGLGNTQMTMSSGNTVVDGNVAVGPNSSLDFSGGGVVNGTLFIDPSSTAKLTGGSSSSQMVTTSLAAAAQQAIMDSSILAGDSATSSLAGINGSQTLNAIGPVSVFDVNGSVNMQGGSKLTLNGSANSFVVLNVTGGMTVGGGSQMQLTGGLTANHVIWNFVGSGQDVNFNGNSTVDGTFLAPNRNITVSGGIVNGAVVGSENGQLKLQSGPKVHGQPVPEPMTLTLLAPVLLLLRRKRQS